MKKTARRKIIEQLTGRKNHPCWAEFPCIHKRGGFCTFREWEEALLEMLAEGDPENRKCYQNMAGVLIEPCLELDDEGRKLGVG